jgi:hypothetical protein
MIGGMEVRMMAVRAVERVGLEATEVGTKGKGDGHAAVVCDEGRREPEARRRAQEAATAVQGSVKQ